MPSTVATAATDDSEPPLRRDSVPLVDLSLFSQAELYALSLSSDSAFDLNRCDDVVIPKINRAIFNESAGSRKQTYSRFRLASAESAKAATLHRRTPHLRASHTHPLTDINDPVQAENSQIIRMLKQLCKSDPNFQDIDQVEEENNIDCNSVLPDFSNTEALSIKRKRGRPRKHENTIFIRPPTDKRLHNYTIKKEIVFDIEKDREIVNSSGVPVNAAALFGLEDPYGPEIRRRTMEMSTEDQLLGFLRGLNGQWGSRRRKRRIVDASEFGDALPKGWKLSLCIKKKEGRIWLYCRRYLSPSGRQFESCKEISTYLISIFGEENLNKDLLNLKSSDDSALKEASENAAESVLQEDVKRDDIVNNPSSPSSSPSSPQLPPSPQPPPSPPSPPPPVPGNCKEQVNDDVKYNHIEPYVKNDIEKTEPPVVPTMVSAGDNVVVESDTAHSDDKLNVCREPKSDELVHDLNIVSHIKQDEHTNTHGSSSIEESCAESGQDGFINDEVSRTVQVPEAAVSELPQDEDLLPVSEKSNLEPVPSGEFHGDLVDSNPNLNLGQGLNSGNFLSSPFPNRLTGTANACATDQALDKNTSICEEKGFDPTMDIDIDIDTDMDIHNNTPDQLISEKDKVVGESTSGFFLGRFGLDQDGATAVKGINVNNLSSGSTSSRLDRPFNDESNVFTRSSRMEENELNKSTEIKVDDFSIFNNNESKRNESDDVLDFNSKTNLEFCSLVPSENDQEFGFQDCLYDDNTMDECKEESSERGLLNHFTDDIFENKMYSTPLDALKFDDDRDLSRNELTLAFGNPNVASKIDEAFDVHTNLSMVNSSMMEDRRGSDDGLFNLSGNVKTTGFGNKFTSGFGSDHGRVHEEVVPSGMWRTGDGSQLQSGLSGRSHAHIPSSSSFHSFNIMSEKGGDGQFRLDERYNQGYGMNNGLRSSRPEPVEFSFLTTRSQHPLQGDSRVFSYSTEMDPQFDSSFWLGKNSMIPNHPTGGRNQMTGVCALCRTEFHLPPVHFGSHDGMASLCPSCSAGMSGHVNIM